jgi:hypothetical protein
MSELDSDQTEEYNGVLALAYTVAELVNGSKEAPAFEEKILALCFVIEIMRNAVNEQTEGEVRDGALKVVSDMVSRLERLTRQAPEPLLGGCHETT